MGQKKGFSNTFQYTNVSLFFSMYFKQDVIYSSANRLLEIIHFSTSNKYFKVDDLVK